MDLFAKCYETSMADEIREKGIYPYFHALESRQDTEVMMEGKRRIMLGSNNYLGLTTHPDVIRGQDLRRWSSMAPAAPARASSTARCSCTLSWKRSWPPSCGKRRW